MSKLVEGLTVTSSLYVLPLQLWQRRHLTLTEKTQGCRRRGSFLPHGRVIEWLHSETKARGTVEGLFPVGQTVSHRSGWPGPTLAKMALSCCRQTSSRPYRFISPGLTAFGNDLFHFVERKRKARDMKRFTGCRPLRAQWREQTRIWRESEDLRKSPLLTYWGEVKEADSPFPFFPPSHLAH